MAFNIWTFLFEIVNFVVLACILHRLLYRPLRAAIDKRRSAIAQAQAEAEKAHGDAIALQRQLQSQLADIEKERQAAIQKTRELAEAQRTRLIADGEQAVRRQRQEARAAIERERDDALRALRAEVSSQAIALAERLLQEAAGTTLQQQLANHLIDALAQLSDAERSRVRTDWQGADGAIVETAAALEPEKIRKINDAVDSVVGQTVKLAVETRPALLAGARLRIGGHVWDASLAGQLDALRSDAAENHFHE